MKQCPLCSVWHEESRFSAWHCDYCDVLKVLDYEETSVESGWNDSEL